LLLSLLCNDTHLRLFTANAEDSPRETLKIWLL